VPVVSGSFTYRTLEPRVTGGIIVVSEELARATDASSFDVLRREMELAAIAAVDTAFIDNILLASDTADPVAVFDASDPAYDLLALFNAVNVTGGGRHLFFAHPTTANVCAVRPADGGARLFPEMGPTGGTMLGVPVVVSDRVPAGSLVLTDCAAFAANEGFVAVERTRQSALQMRTDPASTASQLVPLFQTNSLAIKVLATFAAEKIRPGAVAMLGDIPAGWAGVTTG
jgi:hypothetical protein